MNHHSKVPRAAAKVIRELAILELFRKFGTIMEVPDKMVEDVWKAMKEDCRKEKK